jgi:uncharacterized membrane protein
MTITPQGAANSDRTPDRVAAGLAGGFIVLLLATEVVLSLPDETASANRVATFYADHRAFIIVLQLLGFVAAGLLAGYAWRLRRVDRVVSVTGMITAVCSLVPGLITVVIAVVADPTDPAPAGRWNLLEPRGDDALFVGIVLFAAAVALRLGRRLPALGVLALLVAVACLTRLVLEAAGVKRGPLDGVGPVSFLALISVMAVLSFLGVLRTGARRASAAPTSRREQAVRSD